MVLQWHITDRCNCRCTHCYQETYRQNEELEWSQLTTIVEQFKELLEKARPGGIRGQITLTGGEPLLQEDFFALLELLSKSKQYYDIAILTNGTLITKTIASRLKDFNLAFVQVSIDGVERTHDQLRGQGNYKKTVEAVQFLVQAGVKTSISFTAHRGNFHEFSQVVELGRKLKVNKVWADRHIPMGQGVSLQDQMLTPEETKELFVSMEKARKQMSRRWFTKTKVGLERGLQFLVGGGRPYHCAVGRSLITVMPNGDVYPCRRMPIKIGNVTEKSLLAIFETSPLLREFREPSVRVGCEECNYAKECGGGLACLAYALDGEHVRADPGCWYVSRGHRSS